MRNDELIHISVPASEHDPRNPLPEMPGIVIHYVPDLHPDDVEVVNGLRVTSVERTLIDLGEELEREELLATFYRAWDMDLLDLDKLDATRARVEWRPSLAMVDEVIAEFLEELG
jgi:hypothetical protein